MAQLLTIRWPSYWPYKWAKCGPVTDLTAYIYIYIHTYIHTYIQYIYIYIYIYIYACCCVRKWGAFFLINRSIMLLAMRSKLGRTEHPMSENPYFYCASWGSAAQQLSQEVRDISGMVLGHHPENEALESEFLSFVYGVYGTAFWAQLGVKLACLNGGQKCPELRGKWVFTFPLFKLAHEAQNEGFERMAKIHPHFCVFGGAPGFSKKNGFFQIDRFWLKPLKM